MSGLMNPARWQNCRACGLHAFRRHVVYGDGPLPCELLAIGEAPGETEDLRGKPFCGPAGNTRKKLWADAEALAGVPAPATYITNIVACRPTDERFGRNRTPTGEEALACHERLKEIVLGTKPAPVLLMGKVAQRWARELCPDAWELPHPSAILQDGNTESGQWLGYVRALSEIFIAIKEGRHGKETKEGLFTELRKATGTPGKGKAKRRRKG